MGRKSRLKRQRREQSVRAEWDETAAWERLLREAEEAGLVEKGAVLRGRPAQPMPKLSACIVDIARPILDAYPQAHRQRAAIECAVLAWNLAVIPDAEPRPGDLDEDLQQIVDWLSERKRRLYPNDQRVILKHEVFESGDQLRLNVLSSGPELEPEVPVDES